MQNLDFGNLQESQQLEFKESSTQLPDDIWETYSAFANTEGGTIVLGIAEPQPSKFEPIGVPDASKIIDDFWRTIRNPEKISQDIMLPDGIHTLNYQGMDLVVIDVPRAARGEKPIKVYIRREKRMTAFVRRDRNDVQATERDLELMIYDNARGADRQALERFENNAFNTNTITHYRNVFASMKPQSPWNKDDDDDFLYHIGATAKGRDGKTHPTIAGLLSFGQEYEITNYLPQYILDYREETNEGQRWNDRVVSQSGDWSGNLIDFYFEVTRKLMRHFRMPFTTSNEGTRHESSNPITESVNEAIVNALVHAWYGETASVRIVLRSDSITVTNSGSLLLDKDVAIAGGWSETRNPTIMRFFNFIGAGDRAGTGLSTIWSTWRTNFSQAPKLVEYHAPAQIMLTLPLREAETTPKASKRAVAREQTTNESILLKIKQSGNGLTSKEIAAIFNISERRAQERLKELLANKKLARSREGRFFRYRLM